jgi:carboxylesterase
VDDGRAFAHAGDGRGVLLLHGFTGTPSELGGLGEHLRRAGFTVEAPLLPGHGADAAALDATAWPDWVAGAAAALDALAARCARVAVVGLSMGGLVTLHLARAGRVPLAAIGLLAVPLWLPWPIAAGLRLARPLVRLARRPIQVPKLVRGDVADPAALAGLSTLPVFTLAASLSLRELIRVVRAEVPEVKVPAFVAHGRRDRTAPPACARELASRLGGEVRLLDLPRSRHLLPIDLERAQLADALTRFLVERMP